MKTLLILAFVLAACSDADQQMNSGRTHAICVGLCFTMTMTRQHELVRHKDASP